MLCCLLSWLAMMGSCSSLELTWIGPAGALWEDAVNWNPAVAPGPDDRAILPRGSTLHLPGSLVRVDSVVMREGSVLLSGYGLQANFMAFDFNPVVNGGVISLRM